MNNGSVRHELAEAHSLEVEFARWCMTTRLAKYALDGITSKRCPMHLRKLFG